MSTKRAISSQIEFAGIKCWYDYRYLPHFFSQKSLIAFANKLTRDYSKITCLWDEDLNSQWVCRIYLAMKMILSSSVMAQSLEYAEERNLRIVLTYLEYYSVLSLMRAVVFSSPLVEWQSLQTIEMTHSKTINIIGDTISNLDRNLSAKLIEQITYLKSYRELITYRAPSDGDSYPKLEIGMSTLDLCRTLAELAQFQSEILERSIINHANSGFTIKDKDIQQICSVEIDNNIFYDSEDAYRLDYLKRKNPFPTNILHMMSEGHREDFFGSWCAKEDNPHDDAFCPDDNTSIIFDYR